MHGIVFVYAECEWTFYGHVKLYTDLGHTESALDYLMVALHSHFYCLDYLILF